MSAGDYIALIGLIVTVVGVGAGAIATWAIMGQRIKSLEDSRDKRDTQREEEAKERKAATDAIAKITTSLELITQRSDDHTRRLENHSRTLETVTRMEGVLQRVVDDVEEIRQMMRLHTPSAPKTEADRLLDGLRDILAAKSPRATA